MSRSFDGERGFLTYAVGPVYLRAAYGQCLSIKAAMPDALHAVIVDEATMDLIDDRHRRAFDRIILLDVSHADNPMEYEWTALRYTPWRETIKVDADVYFPRSIDHWWNTLRLKEVCFTSSVFDHMNRRIQSRYHRAVFYDNYLPDIYTALYYFRYGRVASQLFDKVKQVIDDYEFFAREFLINNRSNAMRTDEAFAMAVRILGKEEFMLPGSLIPSITHMREPLIGIPASHNWTEALYTTGKAEIDVGFHPQHRPFHYIRKEWLTDERIRQLEIKRYGK